MGVGTILVPMKSIPSQPTTRSISAMLRSRASLVVMVIGLEIVVRVVRREIPRIADLPS